VTAQSAQRETGRYVKKVGNALLFGDERGRLHLLYVSIALGGWSGSALNYKQSGDEGKTWTDSQPLMLSPFYNRSTLVKNGPAPLTDGGWAVPIYHELLGKFSEILWFQADAGPPVKTRVTGGASHFQPSLTALSPTSALLFNRAISRVRKVHVARTADAGRTWSVPEPLPLLNPDSGLDALRLRDGRLLLAYNDLPKFRENLTLALSADGGTNWTRVAVIEQQAGEEFSYPFLFQSRTGEVHLTYTWKRREIKHVTMTVSWIDQQMKEARP
jgi:predicted neuraminidase